MEIAKVLLEYLQTLVWPIVVLIIVFVFKNEVENLLKRIKTAKLPGGLTFDLESEVDEVQELSEEVKGNSINKKVEKKGKVVIPLTEANSRLVKLGLQPSPSGMDMNYYRSIAKEDPILALAGLRMDIEVLVKNLAQGFELSSGADKKNTLSILKLLLDEKYIVQTQYELVIKVIELCSQAIHGVPITKEQALSIIGSADALIEDYLAWMSWGFKDDWSMPSDNTKK